MNSRCGYYGGIMAKTAKSTNENLKDVSLEDAFSKIEDLLDRMNEDDVPLEESFGMYKEGMELLKHCNDIIDKVEKQIEVLSVQDSEEEDG